MSMRKAIAEYVREVVAAYDGLSDITVVDSVRGLGQITQTTIIVKTDSYEKLAVAPLAKRQGNFTLTLVSKYQDIDRAEDDLDDRLELLLPALLTAGLVWQTATQVGYGDSNLAYDITVTSILTKE